MPQAMTMTTTTKQQICLITQIFIDYPPIKFVVTNCNSKKLLLDN